MEYRMSFSTCFFIPFIKLICFRIVLYRISQSKSSVIALVSHRSQLFLWFESVQKILKQTKGKKPELTCKRQFVVFDRNVFQGKLFCGSCKASMVRVGAYRSVKGVKEQYKIFKCLLEYLSYNRCCLFAYPIICTTFIHLVSVWNGRGTIKYPLFLLHPKGTSYFLGNIPCVHLMHKVFKRNKQKFSAAICISTIIPVNNGYKAYS